MGIGFGLLGASSEDPALQSYVLERIHLPATKPAKDIIFYRNWISTITWVWKLTIIPSIFCWWAGDNWTRGRLLAKCELVWYLTSIISYVFGCFDASFFNSQQLPKIKKLKLYMIIEREKTHSVLYTIRLLVSVDRYLSSQALVSIQFVGKTKTNLEICY